MTQTEDLSHSMSLSLSLFSLFPCRNLGQVLSNLVHMIQEEESVSYFSVQVLSSHC